MADRKIIFLVVFVALLLGQASAQTSPPVLATIGPQSVTEGANLNFATSATDPDLTIPTLTAVDVPVNATYTDNGNGTGRLTSIRVLPKREYTM